MDGSGKINPSQLPAIAVTDTFVVANQTAMLALTAETGDVAVRTDQNKSYILKGINPSTLSDWQELLTPTDSVSSIYGRTGAVTAQVGDYTATQVTNTPAGNISSTTVQGAINELDTEKQDTITGGATTITTSNLTTDRVLVSNVSGKVAVATTTATELGYVSGVTSAIQTQINNKANESDVVKLTGNQTVA